MSCAVVAASSASLASLAYTKRAEEAERTRRLRSDPPTSALSLQINPYLLEVEMLEQGFLTEE